MNCCIPCRYCNLGSVSHRWSFIDPLLIVELHYLKNEMGGSLLHTNTPYPYALHMLLRDALANCHSKWWAIDRSSDVDPFLIAESHITVIISVKSTTFSPLLDEWDGRVSTPTIFLFSTSFLATMSNDKYYWSLMNELWLWHDGTGPLASPVGHSHSANTKTNQSVNWRRMMQ